MKILFVTPSLCYPEVPYAGETTIFKLMEKLSSREHEVFLITGLRSGDEEHLEEVQSLFKVLDVIKVPCTKNEIVKAVIGWVLKGFKGGLTFRKKVAIAVNRFSRKIHFDIVQVEHTQTGEYIKRQDEIPMIIAAHDVLLKPALRGYKLARGMRKITAYFKYRMTKRREITIYQRFDKVYTASDYDRKLLLTFDKNLHVSVRSPYVRIKDFSGDENIYREPNIVLFVGAMDRPTNINAVKYFYGEVFPLIRKEIPEVKFYIVGNKPPEKIKQIGRNDKNVIVTGFVEDIKPFYLKASVFVAPLFIGGGIIVKILDSMAAGLPVVTTFIGNEGIEAVPGRDILIANEAVDFTGKVTHLLRDGELWQSLSKNGKAFVREKFDWSRTVQNIEGEYRGFIS